MAGSGQNPSPENAARRKLSPRHRDREARESLTIRTFIYDQAYSRGNTSHSRD